MPPPDAREEQNDRLIIWLIAIAMLILACVHYRMAGAQEGVMGSKHSHDGKVGQMYQGWQKPNYRRDNEFNGASQERYWSCCNQMDCHPVQTRMVAGRWQFMSPVLGRWVPVPDEVLETNYPDAELTPDGRAHACENASGELLCFTPGDPEL